jgi:hypothetical protein
MSFPHDSIQNLTIAQCLKRMSENTKLEKELGHILQSEEVVKPHFFYMKVQTSYCCLVSLHILFHGVPWSV